MKAYNHSIRFIPELKHLIPSHKPSSNVITVQKNRSSIEVTEEPYAYTFMNNQGRNLTLYTDRPFARSFKGQKWIFDVKGVMTFFWFSSEKTIYYVPRQHFSEKLLEYWTLHIVLPIFLTIEEYCYFLHAGAVKIKDTAVMFTAESFGGKSTMTDFFIKKNHAMISDDKVGIIKENETFMTIPSHPYHRPYRKMEDLGVRVDSTAGEPKPLIAIYTLHRAAADAPVAISEIQGIGKFQTLRFSIQMNFTFLKAKRFKDIGELVEHVPVYAVMVPWDLQRLEEVYIAIMDHHSMLV